MDLREFLTESLKQVVDGVTDAQEYARQKGSSINPKGLIKNPQVGVIVGGGTQFPVPQMIDFDIAVTVSEGKEAKAGIAVFGGMLGLGTQAKVEGANMSVSRIKFSVPVLFPEQATK
jgi:hypothetical protein